MKRPQILALTTLLALTCSTFATPQLRLSDGTTTITIADNDTNDQSPEAGVVTYLGPIGSKWSVNVTVGSTKPSVGGPSEPYMDLEEYTQSSGAADLKLEYTETDFTTTAGIWEAGVGGTTGGTVEFTYFLDSSNTPFGTNTLLTDFSGITAAYDMTSNGTYNITAPYSMTVAAKIHHKGLGTTGFDSFLSLTPTQQQPPTIQCSGDINLGCNPTNIPSCDTNTISVTASCGVSNIVCSSGGPDIVTGCVHERDLVYTVTDNCGQSTSCTQHIYWSEDKNAPSFTTCPGDIDLGCNPGTIPDCDLSKVAATDDCGRVTYNCASVDSADGCSHLRTITYTATDACGNSATCVQHITWNVDTTAPQFVTCAGDQNLGCNPATVPDCDTNSVSATDDCSVPTIVCSSADVTNGCARTRTITYIATDSCGNTASCVQHINWTVDTTKPQFTVCPGDRDLGCNPASIPDCDTNSVSATDTCSVPTITCSSSDSANGCAHTRTITYIATDACGNTASCVQHLTWTVDTTAPSFTKCAADKDLGCNPATVPGCDTNSVAATDDCGTPSITCSSLDSVDGCSHTRTITYVATDACGNSASCVQHLTWNVNTTAPTFTQTAPDQNLGCNPNIVPSFRSTAVAATAVCGSATITGSAVDTTNACGRTRTITYVATDACGNTSSYVQHITWSVNTTKPVFTHTAADRDLGCNPSTIPTQELTSMTSSDDCSTPVTTCTYLDTTNGCSRARAITYLATDACGNTATYVQHLTWTVNTTPPTLTVQDITNYVCGTTCASVTFSDNATSDCSTPVVTYSPASGSTFCIGTNVVTVTATDGCGNKTVKTFKLIVAQNPTCGGSVGHGDTATIGFWHNKNGQALINAMPSPGLGNWLATNYPCMFGNLLGASDATVAAQFQTYFNVTGQKTYAQVMAGALADYVTSTALSGSTKAGSYGFNLSPGGTGAKSFNVGANGTALGLTNNTSYTVSQLLKAAQAKCPWSSTVFNALNNIFSGINQSGDIN